MTESEQFKEIWEKLSQEDVSEYKKDRNGLSYLSWASAFGVMMSHYPGMKFQFEPVEFYPDGSAEVRCKMEINGCHREMWLPVMDFRHKAITSPNARDISDCKMRCLTKCMAIFGLGHYIFDGEDIPPDLDNPDKESKSKKKAAPKPNGAKVDEEKPGIEIAYKEFLKDCKDVVSLERFYLDNQIELEKLKGSHSEIYTVCINAFKSRKQELQGGK